MFLKSFIHFLYNVKIVKKYKIQHSNFQYDKSFFFFKPSLILYICNQIIILTIMKRISFFLGLIFISSLAFSQANRGLNFGVGLNNNGLPVYLNFDIPVHADIAIAPQIQFNLDGMDYFALGVKADYYFDRILSIPENFDFYAGLNLGFRILSNNKSSDKSGLDLGAEIGGRWFWNEKWGLNLQFSGGIGYGTKFGVSMKM